jgi:hypothetical protein
LDRRAFGDWLYGASATGDAALLVIGVAVARFLVFLVASGTFGGLVFGLVNAVFDAVAGWLFLALATWLVGTKLFDGVGDFQTILRMHGLAYLPNILVVFVIVGGIVGSLAAVVGYVWYLVAAVVGTSVGLSLNTRNAALSVIIGAAFLVLIERLIGATFTGIGFLF